MKDLYFYLRRLFFLGALLLTGIALAEKILNFVGYTLLRGMYTSGRLLEFSGVALLFVVVLQLKEINVYLTTKATKEGPK